MFDAIRTFGLTNRPAGYAQVPDGWTRVSGRTEQFAHGVIRYDRALTLREMYSFELTPVYASPRECCEVLLAVVAEQEGRTVERVKAGLREDIAACEGAKMAAWPPSSAVGTMAQTFNRKARIWPLGQYTRDEVFPAMVELLAE